MLKRDGIQSRTDDVNTVIARYQEAIANTIGDVDANTYYALADLLWYRFQESKRKDDLTENISRLQAALTLPQSEEMREAGIEKLGASIIVRMQGP